MPYILHIESTSTICSVAVSKNSELIGLREYNNGYTHAENLHIFIKDLLIDYLLLPKDLAAVSISSGPGSYTGLRIGFSTAKGLAYSLKIPLVKVDTLKALSTSVIQKYQQDALFCPMLDAKRMEVYCAVFDSQLNTIMPVNAIVLNEETISQLNKGKDVFFFGDGMPKAKDLLQTLPKVYFVNDVVASASTMVKLAFEQFKNNDFVDVAYVEPNYLKEFFFTTSKK